MIDLHEIEKKINDSDILQIFTTDLNGRPVTLQVHAGDIEAFFKKGVGFDGSSVPGYGTVDDSDKLLIPISETFRNVEFNQEKLGFLIGKINEGYGERSLLDPRALLEKVVKQAEDEFGFRFLTAPEHEFFLLTTDEFSKDIHTDNA
ncbi:MAG: glutamine synthetase, partial [Planctomycetes bacterium]|nr:glutamine synthetase [Planctomycetota bacterium]